MLHVALFLSENQIRLGGAAWVNLTRRSRPLRWPHRRKPEETGGSRRAPDQVELVPPLIYDHLASTWGEYYAWLTGADGGDDNGAAEGPTE
jgi:hypothetical protein